MASRGRGRGRSVSINVVLRTGGAANKLRALDKSIMALNADANRLGATMRELSAGFRSVNSAADLAGSSIRTIGTNARNAATSFEVLGRNIKQAFNTTGIANFKRAMAGGFGGGGYGGGGGRTTFVGGGGLGFLGLTGIGLAVGVGRQYDTAIQSQLLLRNALSSNISQLGEIERESVRIAKVTRSRLDDTRIIWARLNVINPDLQVAEAGYLVEQVQKAALAVGGGQPAQNAIRQLFQGYASDRLGGDEYRAVSEQLPSFIRALQSYFQGIGAGELRTLAHSGLVRREDIEGAATHISVDTSDLPVTLTNIADRFGVTFQDRISSALLSTEVFNSVDTLAKTFGDAFVKVFESDAFQGALKNFAESPFLTTAFAVAIAAAIPIAFRTVIGRTLSLGGSLLKGAALYGATGLSMAYFHAAVAAAGPQKTLAGRQVTKDFASYAREAYGDFKERSGTPQGRQHNLNRLGRLFSRLGGKWFAAAYGLYELWNILPEGDIAGWGLRHQGLAQTGRFSPDELRRMIRARNYNPLAAFDEAVGLAGYPSGSAFGKQYGDLDLKRAQLAISDFVPPITKARQAIEEFEKHIAILLEHPTYDVTAQDRENIAHGRKVLRERLDALLGADAEDALKNAMKIVQARRAILRSLGTNEQKAYAVYESAAEAIASAFGMTEQGTAMHVANMKRLTDELGRPGREREEANKRIVESLIESYGTPLEKAEQVHRRNVKFIEDAVESMAITPEQAAKYRDIELKRLDREKYLGSLSPVANAARDLITTFGDVAVQTVANGTFDSFGDAVLRALQASLFKVGWEAGLEAFGRTQFAMDIGLGFLGERRHGGGFLPGPEGAEMAYVGRAGELVLNRAQQGNVASHLAGVGGGVYVDTQIFGNVDQATAGYISKRDRQIARMLAGAGSRARVGRS